MQHALNQFSQGDGARFKKQRGITAGPVMINKKK